MQFSSLSSLKMEISETDFFDTLTIQNDQISYVKHVLAPLYVFFRGRAPPRGTTPSRRGGPQPLTLGSATISPCPKQARRGHNKPPDHGGTRPIPRWILAVFSSRGEGGGAPPPSAQLEDTCKVIFQRGEGDHNHPGELGGHEVTASPQTGYKGASQGLGLWPARGGGAQRRGATSGSAPLTGASSGAPGNPASGGRAPRRRLHGRASLEVT